MTTLLITGASKGIGAALALHYAKPNNHLALIGRNLEPLQQIAAQCQQLGATVDIGQVDVSDADAMQTWITAFDQRHPIDIVIANAGVTHLLSQEPEGESLAAIKQVIDINLYGVVHTIQPLITAFRARRHGQIVLISSLAAWRGMPITPAYCASKAGVKAWGEALRGWLAPEGIQVNIVCPGFVESAMSEQFAAQRPFMIQPEKAADLIARGLQRNQAIISFPFPLNWGMWWVGVLPFFIASWLLGLFGYNATSKPK